MATEDITVTVATDSFIVTEHTPGGTRNTRRCWYLSDITANHVTCSTVSIDFSDPRKAPGISQTIEATRGYVGHFKLPSVTQNDEKRLPDINKVVGSLSTAFGFVDGCIGLTDAGSGS